MNELDSQIEHIKRIGLLIDVILFAGAVYMVYTYIWPFIQPYV